jgi:hypothetical protein
MSPEHEPLRYPVPPFSWLIRVLDWNAFSSDVKPNMCNGKRFGESLIRLRDEEPVADDEGLDYDGEDLMPDFEEMCMVFGVDPVDGSTTDTP